MGIAKIFREGWENRYSKMIHSNLSMILVYESWQYLFAMVIAKIFEQGWENRFVKKVLFQSLNNDWFV